MKIPTKIILSISLLYFIGCKEIPNYNPFDDQFDINVNRLIKDKCDTIPFCCGYFNLQQNSGKLRSYYQIHNDNWNKVVRKGFTYYADTLILDKNIHLTKFEYDSILYQNIKINSLKKELEKFNYTIIKQVRGNVFAEKNRDTIQLELSHDFLDLGIVRYLTFFKSPPNEKSD
ncbi:hypothetical protein [Tenacibaculum sp. 190524A05c]|uniref:Uncharacterized protein n=1 Tax=Tenacibaculum platacis TaxID=3137852 RepID=A0ABP1EJ67_9FLAO